MKEFAYAFGAVFFGSVGIALLIYSVMLYSIISGFNICLLILISLSFLSMFMVLLKRLFLS